MPLGLASLRELIRRRRRRPPPAVRPFYSNFDWIDYGCSVVVVVQKLLPPEIKRNISTKIEWNLLALQLVSRFDAFR
jgi:hypothetical protein